MAPDTFSLMVAVLVGVFIGGLLVAVAMLGGDWWRDEDRADVMALRAELERRDWKMAELQADNDSLREWLRRRPEHG